MGLDMYLYQRKRNGGKEAELTEVMYWRKENAIHRWFLDKTDTEADFNCGEIDVDRELLEQFVEEGKKVLAVRYLNHTTAEQFMPTRSGFFFGSTEYDEYYYGAIKRTVEKFEELIKDFDFEENELIYSCWW